MKVLKAGQVLKAFSRQGPLKGMHCEPGQTR